MSTTTTVDTSNTNIPQDSDDTWEKSAIFCLVVFILGFFFPPLWLLAIVGYKSTNNKAYFWFQASMMALFFLCSLLYLAGWVAFIVMMNLKKKVLDPFTGKTSIIYPHYEKIRSTNVEPGEYIAMVFGPLLLLILLWEFIRSAAQLFSYQKLKRKIDNFRLENLKRKNQQ